MGELKEDWGSEMPLERPRKPAEGEVEGGGSNELPFGLRLDPCLDKEALEEENKARLGGG